ncbi:MAG TPA: LuxR C-terminal-related transcriptional regulator [Jiangellaceae bacterium]|nr:LuxR C-terminal-related transcriptional regulator [Jiangellaceae bacterium]
MSRVMDTNVKVPPSATDRLAPYPGGQAAGGEPGGVELLQFAQTLCASTSHRQLERRFVTGFGRLFDLPMYALYVADPWTGDQLCLAPMGVSDSFLARYERGGRELNWLQTQLDATGRAVYNMALMESMDEWLEDPLYTKLKYLHDIRHEVQAPIINRDGVIGTLHCGTNDPGRGFTPYEVRLTEALGRVVGTVIEGIHSREGLERERDQVVVALDRTGTAVVITDPTDPDPRLNEAARCVLAEVVDAERALHRVIARPGGGEGFSRHVEVESVDGGTGLLHGHSSYTRAEGGALITVLELQRDRFEISTGTLMALTPRERDVALFVVDGRSDREIAERLSLSHHTVSQYVKRIYRKLDVSSRVALTRLLLELRDSSRRS